MKKIIVIAIALLAAAGAYAQEGRNIYNKYSDSQGVSAVYISPAMFKLIGKIPELNVEVAEGENMDLAPLILTSCLMNCPCTEPDSILAWFVLMWVCFFTQSRASSILVACSAI